MSESFQELDKSNEEFPVIDVEFVNAPVSHTPKTIDTTSPVENKVKFTKLPLARIKHLMKQDPDCGIISADAVFLVTKATEMFIELLAKESVKLTGAGKRKTVARKDVDNAIDTVPFLCFLDGALE